MKAEDHVKEVRKMWEDRWREEEKEERIYKTLTLVGSIFCIAAILGVILLWWTR